MMMMPTLAVATAHTFVLTVSHGLLFRQPPFTATTLCRRFSLRIHQIASRGCGPLEIIHRNFQSRSQCRRLALDRSHFIGNSASELQNSIWRARP
jgi:hypothetical protein